LTWRQPLRENLPAVAEPKIVAVRKGVRRCLDENGILAFAKPDHCYREGVKKTANTGQLTDFADMFAAMGAEQRLQIMRLLLSAHPKGMVVGDILAELKIAPSTLSHHLEKLKHEGLIDVRRDQKFLWYSANTNTLEDLITFLYSECCSRSKAIKPDVLIRLCK
jgi:ArsR family transcriptional regulator, arsenate/arsenite/antimonite-responsive transcriptional repressor